MRRSFAAPAETYAVNVLGTAHVLDAARAAQGVGAIVVVTSDKCYAPGPHPHGEDDPLGGADPYSSSKAGAELVAASYRDSFALPLATGRAGNVIGGGDWGADRLMPDVLAAASEGRAVQLRNPDAVRPWQHVLNPLAGYLLLAEALHADGAAFGSGWNFGPDPGDELPVRALVDGSPSCGGRPSRSRCSPASTRPRRRRCGSCRPAHERLGWRPAWDLDDGLRAIVEWARAMQAGEDLRAVTLAQIERYGPSAPGWSSQRHASARSDAASDERQPLVDLRHARMRSDREGDVLDAPQRLSSSRSASVMRRMSSSKLVFGFQPSSRSAFTGEPMSRSTSAGG